MSRHSTDKVFRPRGHGVHDGQREGEGCASGGVRASRIGNRDQVISALSPRTSHLDGDRARAHVNSRIEACWRREREPSGQLITDVDNGQNGGLEQAVARVAFMPCRRATGCRRSETVRDSSRTAKPIVRRRPRRQQRDTASMTEAVSPQRRSLEVEYWPSCWGGPPGTGL